MEPDFAMSVEEGLKLSKRVYAGKERYTADPPRPAAGMERSKTSVLPKAPMLYAVIVNPAIVDNPDIPSYQPHVYGRCDPPALIPLQMKEIAVRAECWVETVLVTVKGRWRVHCVMGSSCCDCRLLVPLGEEGSILGVEVNFARKSCTTQVVHREEDRTKEKILKNEYKGFINRHFFSLIIPQVDGGCDISLEVSWSQKLLHKDGHSSIKIPFTFPEYVAPFAKIVPKREMIELNVYTGTEKEVIIQNSTHALKEKNRHVGRFSFLYEADIENWSTKDFEFSYSVFSSDPYGVVLLNSPSVHDHDQRNMFCLYLYPGSNQMRKVFRKEVIFLVDISGSMQGKPLESVKIALLSALQHLAPSDYFNIIAFNEEIHSFSSSLDPAQTEVLEKATQWINKKMIPNGGTDFIQPLNKALGLLSNAKEDSVPYIFLITDGSVENERVVCRAANAHTENAGSMSPRICTFGIGSYCNHYFLQMLSSVGRGKYSAAYDQDSIEPEMEKWFRRSLFPVLTNINIDGLDLQAVEVYPSKLPDLLVECPLIVYGRYEGKFPSIVKVEGRSADIKEMVVNLKVQSSVDIPIEKVVAKQYIDLLTAKAWFFDSKQLEDKVSKLSIRLGMPSEFTNMIFRLVAMEKENVKQKQDGKKRNRTKDEVAAVVHHVSLGFGNLIATIENVPPFSEVPSQAAALAAFEKAVGRFSGLCDCCCWVFCLKACSKMNDQCVITLVQLCTALSCFACFECCSEVCCCSGD